LSKTAVKDFEGNIRHFCQWSMGLKPMHEGAYSVIPTK